MSSRLSVCVCGSGSLLQSGFITELPSCDGWESDIILIKNIGQCLEQSVS